jgi:chromosome segregation ATPase
MSGQGFADLRLNHQREQTAESFWPSFTDVMTVIVMIFLLAMLILLVRNMDLVTELRSTMEAERQAAEQLRARERERASLAEGLATATAEVGRLRGRINALEGDRRAQDGALDAARAQIGALTDERRILADDLETQRKRAEEARAALGAERERLASTEVEHAAARELAQARQEALERAAELTEAQARQIEELEAVRHQLQAQREAREAELTDLSARLSDREASLVRLETEVEAQAREIDRLEAARRELVTLHTASREAAEQASTRQRQLEDTLEQLRADYAERVAELSGVLDKFEAAERGRAEITEDYGQLQQRYERLVRPARSPTGRHVVEVRYAKVGGRTDIRIREPGESGFQTVSRDELDQKLGKISREHEEGLYIKVIFPEDSGLSHDDAWRFTNALHGKYDYYYRDQPAASGDRSEATP